MLPVGASGCVHVVAVDMSGPAKICVEGRNCAVKRHNMCTGVRSNLLEANIGCHEALLFTPKNKTNIGRYTTKMVLLGLLDTSLCTKAKTVVRKLTVSMTVAIL